MHATHDIQNVVSLAATFVRLQIGIQTNISDHFLRGNYRRTASLFCPRKRPEVINIWNKKRNLGARDSTALRNAFPNISQRMDASMQDAKQQIILDCFFDWVKP